jgi:hypothetical protein
LPTIGYCAYQRDPNIQNEYLILGGCIAVQCKFLRIGTDLNGAKSDTYFESFDGISKGRSRKLRSAGMEMVEDVMFIVKLH